MRSLQRRGIALAVAGGFGLLAVACAPVVPPARAQAGGSATRILGSPAHPLLSTAIARGRDLGPLPATTVLHITFGLTGRDVPGLSALLASGKTVAPADYAGRFGPDPQRIALLRRLLSTEGITSHWSPGDSTMAASGTVASLDRLLGVRIDRRIGPDGLSFYAPGAPVTVPSAWRQTVNAIIGLDNYPRARSAAIRSPNGVSPSDMLDFYNVNPLRTAGLTGAGMTVVLIEIDQFDPAMLAMYASKFNLPAFDVSVQQGSWGKPAAEAGEADLDLEIVHGIAPGAKLVVYYASSTNYLQAEAQMFKDFPQGAIESSSVGQCERPQVQNDGNALNDVTAAAAAQGWSMFVASGDRGAYDCTPNGDYTDLAADLDASMPAVTAVGGTYVFLSSNGGYFHETAWGEPIEQWGSNGGLSIFWKTPAWQAGPGVQNQYSNGMRQTPDISANADGQSGWDVFANGMEEKVGGTSAAAPFWAAIAALIDQDLKQKGLPLIGFANPALYYFAQSPAGLPAPPFHDITQGTNLYYPATSGWDYATGLGTPDVGALTNDFEWYATHHPAG
jgi:kumamolisin